MTEQHIFIAAVTITTLLIALSLLGVPLSVVAVVGVAVGQVTGMVLRHVADAASHR